MSMKPEEMLKTLIDDYRGRGQSSPEYLPGLAAFGLGIIVGAGVALLFAPTSGQELRGEISERVDDLRHGSDEEFEQRNAAGRSTSVA